MSAYPPPRFQQPFIFNPNEFYGEVPSDTGSTLPTTEFIYFSEPINPDIDITYMAGDNSTPHNLGTPTTDGFSKTIVNINENAFRRIMSNRNSYIERTGIVYAIEETGLPNELIVGGDFGNVIRNGVAVPNTANLFKLDLGTGNITSIGAVNGIVYAIHRDRSSSLFYVGGAFTTINGVTMNRIARWTGSSFSPLGTGANIGTNNTVLCIRSIGNVPTTTVYVGGSFTSVAGGTVTGSAYLARWEEVSNSWFNATPLGNQLNGTVRAIDANLEETFFIIGGDFTTAGALTLNRVARVTPPIGITISAVGAGISNGSVRAIAISSSSSFFYIGGNFTESTTGSTNLVKWNTFLSQYQPLGNPYDVPSTVQALKINQSDPYGNIYIGGNFNYIGDLTTCRKMAMFNLFENRFMPCGQGFLGDDIHTLSMTNFYSTFETKLFIGGRFHNPDGFGDTPDYQNIIELDITKINTIKGTGLAYIRDNGELIQYYQFTKQGSALTLLYSSSGLYTSWSTTSYNPNIQAIPYQSQ